jgi:hypothetical protein
VALQPLNSSIVVLAESHNPSILHPSFLQAQGIVPSSWLPAAPPLCTSTVSLIKYENGIHFALDLAKLQVIATAPPQNLKELQIAPLVSLYLYKLPHVPYRAVGINFSLLHACPEPEALLRERFLKEGGWSNGLSSVNLGFAYTHDDTRVQVKLDPATIETGAGTSATGIRLDMNFHKEVEGLESAVQAVNTFQSRCDESVTYLARLGF